MHANFHAGPIGAQNMSMPILFVSNTLDPVTPLAEYASRNFYCHLGNANHFISAHAMSALFNGSVVLEQHAEGVCSSRIPSCILFALLTFAVALLLCFPFAVYGASYQDVLSHGRVAARGDAL